MTARPMPASGVIRASAGTGKTYRLTARYIELLAAGAAPEAILATTFTRKAAGEIRRRVMRWLADAWADDAKRAELAGAIANPDLTAGRCAELLGELVASLHRLQIGTLDSFFNRLAGLFHLELGLRPRWRICDATADNRLRDRAVAEAIERICAADRRDLLLRMTRDNFSRAVLKNVRDFADTAHRLYLRTEPHAWGVAEQAGELSAAERTALAEDLRAIELPTTQAGQPDKRWVKAMEKLVEAIDADDWAAVVSAGLLPAWQDKGEYYKHPFSDELDPLMQAVRSAARAGLLRPVAEQTRAIRDVTAEFDATYRQLQDQRGDYRFDDITAALAAAGGAGGADVQDSELFRRLDARIEHVLLDEFQDTATDQWTVLAPLARRALAGGPEGRSLLAVGDEKQAIYGWRGGKAALLDRLAEDLPAGCRPETLAKSYRSSPVVMDLVNRVFDDLAGNDALADPDKTPGAGEWSDRFCRHETAKTDMPGWAELIVADEPDPDEPDPDEPAEETDNGKFAPRAEAAVEAVAGLVGRAGQVDIGVLVRKNKHVGPLIERLRRAGIVASEEGGNPLSDSPAVAGALAMLRLADHPDHSEAAFDVAHSPIGERVGLDAHDQPARRHAAAAQVRRELQQRGLRDVLADWLRSLHDRLTARDRRRFRQLLTLAEAYQEQYLTRAADFERFVRATHVEDPASRPVRVMTIHASKGLEFDAVVLPDLQAKFFANRPSLLTLEPPEPQAPPERVSLYISEKWRSLHPDFEAMHVQYRRERVREELCNLYVALTRARQAVYMVVAPDAVSDKTGEPAAPPTCCFAGVLRGALAPGEVAEPGRVLWQSEHERARHDWYADASAGRAQTPPPTPRPLEVAMAAEKAAGMRNCPRVSPSSLAGEGSATVASLLRPASTGAALRGLRVHAFFQQVRWLDDDLPGEEELTAAAERMGLGGEGLEEDLAAFGGMCRGETVARALSRENYPAGLDLRVYPERPFAVRHAGRVLSGQFDRLVVGRREGQLALVEVTDYKTSAAANEPAELDRQAENYRPQLEAYRQAARQITGADAAGVPVAARILFVTHDALREIE